MCPLILPQIDPDKNNLTKAINWFNNVNKLELQTIVIGSSLLGDILNMQKFVDIAIEKFNFNVLLYIHNLSGIKGVINKSAVYWTQVPNSQNTFFGWDGLILNAFGVLNNNHEAIPTVYVFDSRDQIGTANWLARGNLVPREKPEISLAIAKAAEYLGIRFYIMAGGSGSKKPPPIEHVKILSEKTKLFVIPTSGINKTNIANDLFAAGADAIHIGNLLEKQEGFEILKKIVEISKQYPGKKFL